MLLRDRGNRARSRRFVLIFASGWLAFSIPLHGAILWREAKSRLVHDNAPGEDFLHGLVKPETDVSSDTLYFKFRVDPISDAITEYYWAGLVLYENSQAHLGVGNARQSWGYSAFNVTGRGMVNDVDGEYDLRSANSEIGKKFEYVRRAVARTIVFKVQYIPGHDAHVTVWLNPVLSANATENDQPTNIVTQFEAKATFNQIHLIHSGSGPGWNISDLMIATTFEDFLTPEFWQTWWFRTTTVGVLLLLVGFGVRLHERRRSLRQIQRLERERAVADERERIARDIHDELGAELAQIGLLADVGTSGPSGQATANQNFSRIARRARIVVAALDEIVWAVDPRNDNLSRLADYLCHMADEFFDGSPIRCRKDVPTQLPLFRIRAEVRHDLTLAVKEAFTNLVKHANASEVWLRLVWQEPELLVSVDDNGSGFDIAAAEHGNGLDNQRRRLERIGGIVELNSQPGHGTKINFRVRLKAEN